MIESLAQSYHNVNFLCKAKSGPGRSDQIKIGRAEPVRQINLPGSGKVSGCPR
jgi:hypothetical protein